MRALRSAVLGRHHAAGKRRRERAAKVLRPQMPGGRLAEPRSRFELWLPSEQARDIGGKLAWVYRTEGRAKSTTVDYDVDSVDEEFLNRCVVDPHHHPFCFRLHAWPAHVLAASCARRAVGRTPREPHGRARPSECARPAQPAHLAHSAQPAHAAQPPCLMTLGPVGPASHTRYNKACGDAGRPLLAVAQFEHDMARLLPPGADSVANDAVPGVLEGEHGEAVVAHANASKHDTQLPPGSLFGQRGSVNPPAAVCLTATKGRGGAGGQPARSCQDWRPPNPVCCVWPCHWRL